MLNIVIGNSMDEIQASILKILFEKGSRVKPRGQWILELTPFVFQLNNPRSRLINHPKRKFNLMFAFGELLWYLRGSNSCEIISYYNKRFPQFSDDGKTLYGAYGKRIFNLLHNNVSQWDVVISKLKQDPDTRQAIIQIYSSNDGIENTRDTPCTNYLQFFIRDNKLDMIVNMRSNDIIWGTSNDVFSFTMMQEILANQLNVELGKYTHFTGSMHLYDRHLELAESLIKTNNSYTNTMPIMPLDPWKEINYILNLEEDIRRGDINYNNYPKTSYWSDISRILELHYYYRKKNKNKFNETLSTLPSYYASLLESFKL